MFEVGQRVMIRPDSGYYGRSKEYNPKDVMGTVTSTDTHYEHNLRVLWETGKSNNYRLKDLFLVAPLTEEDVLGV